MHLGADRDRRAGAAGRAGCLRRSDLVGRAAEHRGTGYRGSGGVARPGSRLVGARLRPGAAGPVLGLPASELRDVTPDAAEVLGARATDASWSSWRREPIRTRSAGALHWARCASPIRSFAPPSHALARPRARVGLVAAELGVSARQLQRRVSEASDTARRCFSACCASGGCGRSPGALAELALDAGYADQAHMTAEVTRLAGISPVRFLKDRGRLPASVSVMPIDQAAAERLHLVGRPPRGPTPLRAAVRGGPAEAVVEALRGYRNSDGGFGHGLEPDLRGPGSQPAPTLYALEILDEAGAADSELARGARAWIAASPIQTAACRGAARVRGLPACALVRPRAGLDADARAGRRPSRRRRGRGRVARPRHRLVLGSIETRTTAGRLLVEVRLRVPRHRAR